MNELLKEEKTGGREEGEKKEIRKEQNRKKKKRKERKRGQKDRKRKEGLKLNISLKTLDQVKPTEWILFLPNTV